MRVRSLITPVTPHTCPPLIEPISPPDDPLNLLRAAQSAYEVMRPGMAYRPFKMVDTMLTSITRCPDLASDVRKTYGRIDQEIIAGQLRTEEDTRTIWDWSHRAFAERLHRHRSVAGLLSQLLFCQRFVKPMTRQELHARRRKVRREFQRT